MRTERLPDSTTSPAVPTRRSGAPESLSRYTRTAVVLHWAIAVLIIANVGLAWSVDYLPDERVRGVIDLHKSTGITVLGFVVMRVLWRFAHRPPALPTRYAVWERRTAHVVHLLLYGLMAALPLSGWLHDSAWKDAATHPMTLFGIVPWPRIGWVMDLEPATRELWHDRFGALHAWFGYVLYAAVALHLAGAAKHQWIDREPFLARMGFGKSAR